MLGQREKKTYLNIADGKVVRRTEGGKVERYDYVEGLLERIYTKEREFRGEKVPYWYLDLRDSKTGEVYSLGVGASSGVWRSIIFNLGSPQFNPLLPLRISPYMGGDYCKVSVYSGEDRLDWVEGIPPVEEILVGGRRVKSAEKREEFISRIVEEVNRKVGA